MNKRVGIFGGSFNPPHNGHVEICRYLLQKNDVDEIWAVPCFSHPFGKDLASFEDRMNMCRFAFGEFKGKVKVLDVEERLGGVSFSVDTVKYVQSQNPDIKFSFIVGSDTLGDIDSWKGAKELKAIVPLIKVPRGINSPIPDISASNVRDCIKRGKRFTDMVPMEVAVYIVTHGLYH